MLRMQFCAVLPEKEGKRTGIRGIYTPYYTAKSRGCKGGAKIFLGKFDFYR